MNWTFAHYSERPLSESALTRVYRVVPEAQKEGMKPAGFWISAEGNGDGWREWCEAEEWGLGRLAHRAEVKLSRHNNILWLKSPAEIDWITREYGRNFGSRSYGIYYLDWPEIARKWQGLIIAPYQWSRRFDGGSDWYYGWDCASGCIWGVEAIAEIGESVSTGIDA